MNVEWLAAGTHLRRFEKLISNPYHTSDVPILTLTVYLNICDSKRNVRIR